MALTALGRSHDPPEALDVVAVEVDPTMAQGGSLIPAWPHRRGDGVTIEFVTDWGAMLSVWRSLLEPDAPDIDELLLSGQRVWVGIANDVLQLFVPDPPTGSYSMVRHHALMLVAATLWLGTESTRQWQAAHARAAQLFLRDLREGDLWFAIDRLEQSLNELLQEPRSRSNARACVEWMDRDRSALAAYQMYLSAASLGVAALLESEPVWTPDRLTDLVCHEHQSPDFNRRPIERFAMGIRA
jgi:hypothetical protein